MIGAEAFNKVNAAYNTCFVIFPCIQVLGLCVFKPSNDPLSNVSALSYLKLVSMNQAPTKSYWDSMCHDEKLETAALQD